MVAGQQSYGLQCKPGDLFGKQQVEIADVHL